MITEAILKAHGYNSYNPLANTGDYFCVGYFQKANELDVIITFWTFEKGKLQINVEYTVHQKDYNFLIHSEIKGIPSEWSIQDLENFIRIEKL